MDEITCARCGAQVDELDAVQQDGLAFCSDDCAEEYEEEQDEEDEEDEENEEEDEDDEEEDFDE